MSIRFDPWPSTCQRINLHDRPLWARFKYFRIIRITCEFDWTSPVSRNSALWYLISRSNFRFSLFFNSMGAVKSSDAVKFSESAAKFDLLALKRSTFQDSFMDDTHWYNFEDSLGSRGGSFAIYQRATCYWANTVSSFMFNFFIFGNIYGESKSVYQVPHPLRRF